MRTDTVLKADVMAELAWDATINTIGIGVLIKRVADKLKVGT